MGSQKPRSGSAESICRILDTAAEVFSESGFAGARMDEIADRAGVNKATIYYHIGNKQSLYARVLREHFFSAVDRFDQSLAAADSPQDKLSSFIRQIAHEMTHAPQKATMMLREAMDGGQNFPDSLGHDLAGIIDRLTGILAEGEKQGSFIHVNPVTIHFLVLGALAFYRISAPVREKIFQAQSPQKSTDSDPDGEFVSEIECLILRSLSPKLQQ